MKITLINTPLDLSQLKGLKRPVYDTLFYNSAPLGIAYLAAVLLQHGHEPGLIDALVERLDFPHVIARLKALRPDVVGITSTSVSYHGARLLATAIKDWQPHLPVLYGGPHVSALPVEAMSEGAFDFGFISEGEESLVEFLAAYEAGDGDREGHQAGGGNEDVQQAGEVYEDGNSYERIAGLVWRRNGAVIVNPPRRPLENLDSIPMPARHLLPIERYRPIPIDARSLPKLTLTSSRGCPYQCIFCDKSVFGRRYRTFSPGRVGDELQHLVREYGARDFAFLDSLFNITTKRVEDILDELERRNLDISWSCSVRVDALSYELLQRMKRCGCWRIRIGIESGNPEVLKFINKEITLEQVKRVTRWAHELGLQPKAFFMIGHLADTPATIEDSIRFATSIPLKDVTVQINSILRNTKQYELYRNHGYIIEAQSDQYSFWEPMFVPKGMTKEQLEELHRKFYRAFYLRPSLIWRHLKQLRSWHAVWVYASSLRLPLSLFWSRKKRNR